MHGKNGIDVRGVPDDRYARVSVGVLLTDIEGSTRGRVGHRGSMAEVAAAGKIACVVTVPKNHLVLIAGLVWCLAGTMVCVIGLPLELGLAPSNLVLFPLAVVIFLAFYVFVFSRLVRKHTGRIRARPEERLPVWNFFNASSWAVMAVMMGGGMALRLSHLMPDWMIAFFYSGLGVALVLCGIRFLGIFARKDVLALAPDRSRAEA
jgi:small-conductance mechanosensitive channel